MSMFSIITITFISTFLIAGLMFHYQELSRRVKELEKEASIKLTAKGKLPRQVQDDLMDAISTVNYLRMQRDARQAYEEQLWNQLVKIRDQEVDK